MLDTVQSYYDVREYTANAKGIAFDTCHKIYVLMDDEQVELMRGYGYDPLITSDQLDPSEMATVAMTWFKNACALKFIQAVYSDDREFIDIISQFEEDEEDEEQILVG